MNSFITILMIIAMLAALGTLGLGLFSMMKGGEFNKKYGNRLMQARVMLQCLAIALLALIMFTSRN